MSWKEKEKESKREWEKKEMSVKYNERKRE